MSRCKEIMLAFVLVWTFCIPSAFAEEKKSGEPLKLEPVEVVASPVIEGNLVTDYASQVTTVTEKQVESLNAQDLPSALRRVPGVNISRYNLVGSYGGAQGGTVYIRGMGAERPGAEIQTLIDGKPSFQGIFTHPLMDLLSVDNAERIEIYKGAQPVFFGNMSHGAVNVISKRKTTPGYETKLGAAYGSYNTLNTLLQHGGKIDRFDYYLIGSYKASDGHRENADGQLQNYFGRLGYQINQEWDFSFTSRYTDNWAQDPGVEGSPKPPIIPRFTTRDAVYDLTLAHNHSWGTGQVKLFYDNGVVRWRQYDSVRREQFDSNTDWTNSGFKVEEKLRLWPGGEVALGYDYLHYGGKFEEVRPTQTRRLEDTFFYNSAPYLAMNQVFGEKLKIIPSAGIRYNMSRYFGDDIGWQAGLILRYEDTEFHAQYARGFNLPGVYAVYQYLVWNRGDQWKNLRSEKIDHYEVGVSQKLASWLKGDLTFFWDNGKDRLIFKTPPPRFENLTEYRTWGAEMTLTFTPFKELEVFAGGTFLEPTPDDLPYAPKITFTAGAAYSFLRRFLLNIDGQYVAERYVSNPRYPSATPDKVSDYYLLNAKLTFRLTPKGAAMPSHLFLAGENLTDQRYEYLKGYPAPGITIMGGANVAF
ncbi:MAG: TonB-dependent receptor plug domain-containing protein [Thermodesulfobacteriota bacterium]|nr:TonB-dependent receptor plug domain-containing protein [Thermodesulfobacteriota bacterium]